MNVIFLFLIFTKSIHQDTSCLRNFCDAATKDTSLSANYVKVRVLNSKGKEVRLVVSNLSLYRYFTSRRHLSFRAYQDSFYAFTMSKKPLDYATHGYIFKLGGVVRDRYVERIAKKGRDAFIEHFFKQKVIFNGDYIAHKEEVLAKLFDLGMVPKYIDGFGTEIRYKSDCILDL